MAMNEKERLTDLIQEGKQDCGRHWAGVIANYLLSHGVIVPPVKVGDTVRYVSDIYGTVKSVKIKGYTFVMSEEPEKDMAVLLERENGTEFWQMLDIFLCKCEEAEKALERDKDGDKTNHIQASE